MGTVLGGMRHVRWHELRHAYGSASQVPGTLSRIAWGDGPTAEEALSDLGQWIGEPAVFDSTVAAVPFLWELVATETVKDRAGVLELLGTILTSGHALHPEWTRAAHEAVAAGRPTAARLATASRTSATSPQQAVRDSAVRTSAVRLLAALDEHTCSTCLPRTA
ncbi:hypothetical protein [Streptomyces sp. cmx-18-6]|uniref:hypothetical protein n=1 Tax=Streptomyces sp. cmx-18-6 TaxID=2790930 RepID=UPI0039805078